tara:strand:- start:882 stop:1052 length:171 start_codon:yes stop_codon:yes gene_type:complete
MTWVLVVIMLLDVVTFFVVTKLAMKDREVATAIFFGTVTAIHLIGLSILLRGIFYA